MLQLPVHPLPPDFPDADELAALRGWYAGLSTREAVARYLPGRTGNRQSARGVLGSIRRALVAVARYVRREDLVAILEAPGRTQTRRAKTVPDAIEELRHAVPPEAQVSDPVECWFPGRVARVLQEKGITTLADLTVRIPRRKQWWKVIPGLGVTNAKRIEAFFASHPGLTERARALITERIAGSVVPWEVLQLPREVDGTEGTFRAPRATCTLDASNDYEAVQAWLSLHESRATRRAYCKEAERLILWAVVERGRAMSSLTTEDAVAYRTFLRRPMPRERWVGPVRSRGAPDWRPFKSGLSARSAAHSLSVLSALFRWLVEQRYVLANPFAGLKVKGSAKSVDLATSRAFTDGEWDLLRAVADGIEWSCGWSPQSAGRLRFLLDFGFATGLRSNELVGVTLSQVETDARGEHWLHVTGKGRKGARVALPSLAWRALEQCLLERGLPVSMQRWNPHTPIVGSLDADVTDVISGARLWAILKRFFRCAAEQIQQDNPALAGKLRHASPHWLRHTHATYALSHGAALVTVRDNLRHASIATTSIYLHGDDQKRAQQLEGVFGVRN
ncbi:phage integrase family protein [Paraburkholderia caribensis]|uniref:phage integrase family protein n=1 Tax=Paraburkholderia TaxID=1822464 RepID=UPI001CB29934|nr:phage integrase family protein [Paraburkholderia caribensis]BEU23247.1 phage integrase family protein [Paraburkholderia sp. 22B1P]CAG9251880.1 Integrase [Paraburkholderia caribensis]